MIDPRKESARVENAYQQWQSFRTAYDYAAGILSGEIVANAERIEAAERFFRDLLNPAYDIRMKPPEFVIRIIERTIKHNQGEKLDGTPLKGTPLILEPWQVFVVVNLLCFYKAGTNERRFKEAFVYVPRKNGKTLLIAGLAWGVALMERASGSSIYIVGASKRQAVQSFNDIIFSLDYIGELDEFRVLNNNQETSIERKFRDNAGREVGSIRIEALAANPDRQDSLNSNVQICDEVHAYKNAKQYNVIKESGKAYTNRLCIGITTAGDDTTSFCYNRLKYCQKVLSQVVKDESIFIFICKADETGGEAVDYLDPVQHEKANPNYRVSIRPDEMMDGALQAQNDPQQRKDFLAKSLNVYTSAIKAYFDINEFQSSDAKYNWTIDELAKMPIEWYGGADLSRLHDLTAAALVGQYEGVDIIITHGFFPIVNAHLKADEDNIPLFGWKDDGWLTMSNTATTQVEDVVRWFCEMRDRGFKIKQIGHDRKFAREYFTFMKRKGFRIIDQPQLYILKSEGFRQIENQAKNGRLYYLHSEAFEYCVSNVHGVEKVDDMIQYEKVAPKQRIDLFDAAVFAEVRRKANMDKQGQIRDYFGGGSNVEEK